MSDEAVAGVPGLPALQYTLKHYLLYLSQVRERAAALSQGERSAGGLGSRIPVRLGDWHPWTLKSLWSSLASASGLWTPHLVETALWTWVVGQKLCPNLMPELSPSQATQQDTRPARKHRTQAK
jgi:hypothetical protein